MFADRFMDTRYLYKTELVNKSSHHLNDTYVYKYMRVCAYIYIKLKHYSVRLWQQQQDGSI